MSGSPDEARRILTNSDEASSIVKCFEIYKSPRVKIG